MQFNPDINKQANEVIFSRKSDSANVFHPPIDKCPSQKHLEVVLDSKSNFHSHVDEKIKKCNKLIGLMRRLSVNLPRKALHTIYKSFDLTLTMVLFCMMNQIMKIFRTR